MSKTTALHLEPATANLWLSSSSVSLEGAVVAKCRVLTASGLPIARQRVSVFGGQGLVTGSQGGGSTDSAGEYWETLLNRYGGGITAAVVMNVSGSSATASVDVKSVAATYDFRISPTSTSPGSSVQIFASLKDEDGRVISGRPISLSSTGGVSFATSTGKTNGAGNFSTTATVLNGFSRSVITVTVETGADSVSTSAVLRIA